MEKGKRRKISKKKRRDQMRRRRILFFCLVCFGLYLIHGLWEVKFRLANVKVDEVEAVDLYVMPDQQMVHLDNKKELKWIVKKVRKISGHKEDLRGQAEGQVRFIHLYLNDQDPIEISQTGDQVAVNGKWYRVKKMDLYHLDKIFSAYFK